MQVTILPALGDNYIYLLHDDGQAIVIDPGAADPVHEVLQAHDLTLQAIWITHAHYDHVAGVPALKERTGATVYGPPDRRLTPLDQAVEEGMEWPCGDATCTVWETPGHADHDVSYLLCRPGKPAALFCGDTLFASGCGRILDGSAAALWRSLQRIKELPDDTELYCGHEYTLENLRFACAALPDRAIYRQRLEQMQQRLAGGGYSVPTTVADEKQANPFLQCASLDEFRTLRARKDRF